MKKISDYAMDLRNAYMGSYKCFCEEMEKRGVTLERKMKDQDSLSFYSDDDEGDATGYCNWKTEASVGDEWTEITFTVSFNSFKRNGIIYNGFKFSSSVTYNGGFGGGSASRMCPIEFLDDEEVLDKLANYLMGNDDNLRAFSDYLEEKRKSLDLKIWDN